MRMLPYFNYAAPGFPPAKPTAACSWCATAASRLRHMVQKHAGPTWLLNSRPGQQQKHLLAAYSDAASRRASVAQHQAHTGARCHRVAKVCRSGRCIKLGALLQLSYCMGCCRYAIQQIVPLFHPNATDGCCVRLISSKHDSIGTGAAAAADNQQLQESPGQATAAVASCARPTWVLCGRL
jgi:hypothetical protein